MDYDLIIIGAGPAGYVAAIRAGQAGLKTAIVEKKNVGGMCLNWGCIPSKAMLESAKYFSRLSLASEFGVEGIDPKKLSFSWEKGVKRSERIVRRLTKGVEFLLKKNNVEIITGTASLEGEGAVVVDNRNLTAKNIIIATGSYPRPLPFKVQEKKILNLENMFSMKDIPHKLLVAGEGPVAAEVSQLLALIGRDVTFIKTAEKVFPALDDYLNTYITRRFETMKIKVIEGSQGFDSINVGDYEGIVNCMPRKGIRPSGSLKPDTNDSFYITDDHFMTSVKGVYAVGDVNGRSIYAHAASAQALAAVNHILGITETMETERVPLTIYTDPEIAQIGKTEQQLTTDGVEYKVNEFPLSANGKALTEGNPEGILRIISEPKYGEVLGVQIIAHNATDMISEAAAYMAVESTVWDVARTMHAHPTISEVFLEAGSDAIGTPVHK
ncbi:MAG: FAD-dependent oxidoreductase [Bacteroidales bacterium]|jgi:dihydrolipoamide dehydrogenase|nr:FAD-dependent oxidoreductase [Bacteroidales bacterium]